MEVDNAGEGVPTRYQTTNVFVAKRGFDCQDALQLVPRAYVVPRKDVQPAETAKQHVLRGPATDATQPGQALDRRDVIEPM